ncbi:hypothetical protein [Microvirga calopogonii]|uniref:hypothetical protein n=1 Tax=Microvirga calopogonii TaxID=2078013 RepID=UPI000E0D6872|nr:hypothetical protein [Microvirga calopogonii]
MEMEGWQKESLDRYVHKAYGTDDYEVLGATEMLWSGWECDTDAVLIRLADGRKAWAVMLCVNVPPKEVPDALRERIEAYRKAIADTEALLAKAEEQP